MIYMKKMHTYIVFVFEQFPFLCNYVYSLYIVKSLTVYLSIRRNKIQGEEHSKTFRNERSLFKACKPVSSKFSSTICTGENTTQHPKLIRSVTCFALSSRVRGKGKRRASSTWIVDPPFAIGKRFRADSRGGDRNVPRQRSSTQRHARRSDTTRIGGIEA